MIRRLPLLLLLIVLTSCASPPGTSIATSVGASPSSVGSPSVVPASPSSLPFPVVSLPPQSLARVATTVDLTTQPGGPVVATVDGGTEVVIVSGPRDVDGATWFELQWPPAVNDVHDGWLRVDDPSALVGLGDASTCPDTADGLLTMLAYDRLRCFGDNPAGVTVEGTVGHCQGGVVLAEPGWLAYACWAVSDGTNSMPIHAAPASGIVFPDDTVRVRLTGHFDDPASSTCVYTGDPDPLGRTPSPTEQAFLCREAFVVDTFEILEVIGTPPAA